MGYEEVPGIKNFSFIDLSAGWFPGKEHNDIPGGFEDSSAPLGMVDGDSVVWYEGALRKMFGYDNVNTSALSAGATVTSFFFSPVLDDYVTTVGAALFSGADTAVPTDITGALVITPDNQVDWAEWQFETDTYVMGVNQADPSFKWDGGAAGSLLANAPQGRWIEVFQNSVWIGNTSTETSTLFFSNLGDPETWTADDDYKFDAPIQGMAVLQDKLVVFKQNSIGVLSGSNNRILTKVDRYIDNIGCSGGHTIVNCKLQGKEVIVFHSHDGFYAFDGSQELVKLSNPIQRKYIAPTATSRWNDARYGNAWATYSSTFNWYMCSLSDGGDAANDFMVILDMNRIYQNKSGFFVPHWPVDGIDANCIHVARDSREQIYFGGTDGFNYLFDPALFNRNGAAYEGFFQSKVMDAVESWVVQEVNILGDQQGVDLDVFINADLQSGDGETANISFQGDADVLDSSFIMDTSLIGGLDFLFNNASIGNFGRFLQFKFSNDDLDESIVVESVNLVLQGYGLETNLQ